ncbi:PREDICTED: lectin-like [Lupinus angustifolius]|nr:PREDICTED: lectin-like [Lupinus angustifolius]
MGAEFSQPEASQQQQQQQQLLQPQQQQQLQPQQQQLQPQQQQQQRQKSQQKQPQPQLQPLSNEQSSRGGWIVSPQREVKPYANNTREVVKPSGSQSSTPVKPVKEASFPHNYEEILKDADSPVDKSSRDKLCDQLYAGVFLDRKTKKYWLDKKSNANCFMLYAKALSITWAENQNYWKWLPQKEASGTMTEVAELKRVCWLEVHGKFDTRKLSPGILYEVSFVVMLKDPAQGWEVPVNVRLVLPGGKKQEHKEKLIDKLRMRKIEIPVGEFVASAGDNGGEMEFSLYEYEGGMWKQGLVIEGVTIKPKN